MADSSIEWTDKTWNPVTGCTKVSAGCRSCYAEKMHHRLTAMGQPKYAQPFTTVVTHDDELLRPFDWKRGQHVFVNSMSDLFHDDVPFEFRQRVFATMNLTERHTYQILTKRADRLHDEHMYLNWSKNIWMGVSVEDERVKHRIDYLRHTNAYTKFLSIEPLIGPLPNLNLHGIDWVIVGGESGGMNRPMKREWVLDLRDQCEAVGVAFFFKQWGGANKALTGRLLDGQEYNAMPTPL